LGMIIGFNGFDFLLKKIKPILLGLIGVLFFTLLFIPPLFNIEFWLIIQYSFVGISTSLILFSVMNSKTLKSILSNKTLVFLGKRSYGLYLYHILGNSIANHLAENISLLPSNSASSFFYSFTITILMAIVSYKFVETPFLKLKKKYEVIVSRPI